MKTNLPMTRRSSSRRLPADADAYAKEVVMADFEEVGDEDVFRKLRGDLPATVSDHQIRHAMEELMSEAIEQIQNA